MSDSKPIADIKCDILSDKVWDNGKPKWQPITIGSSIVCDGWVHGQTTAVFTHFHEDHTWNIGRTLSNCHHILLTEPTYLALRALKKIPERANIERLPYNRPFTTAAGEKIELINANHVAGSCQVLVTMEDTGETILYSGDFCYPELQTPKANVLVLDGVHGIPEYDFDTDKPSILRRIFDTVIEAIGKDQPVEIQAQRGTMQDIMAELCRTSEEGDFIPEDIPFLAHKNEIDLTEAIEYTYKECGCPIRKIEPDTTHRLNELYNDEKRPYVRFTRPGTNSAEHERATVIQADVNPHFKRLGPMWSDKNGKWYACLAAHAGYSDILKYVSAINPDKVIIDGTRVNSETANSLANTISKELNITAYSKNC